MRARARMSWCTAAMALGMVACSDGSSPVGDHANDGGLGDAATDGGAYDGLDAAQPVDAMVDAGSLDASTRPDAALDGGSGVDAGDPALANYDGPLSLQEAGLYKAGSQELADGVAAYAPRFALWSDGAKKKRYLRLPEGEQIDTADMDAWQFPIGTRAFKEFTAVDPVSGDEVRIETRMLEKRSDGWLMISFLWNAEQTDAVPVPRGQQNAHGTAHDVPSQDDCRGCHEVPGDRFLGLSAIQLSHSGGEAPPAPLPEITLASLRAAAMLTVDPGTDVFALPGDATAQAALGVLHADCGSCHRPGTLAYDRSEMMLQLLTTELDSVEATGAYRTTVGVENWKRFDAWPLRIAPGEPERSTMYGRMASRKSLVAMPPLGTEVVDQEGVDKVGAWIEAL